VTKKQVSKLTEEQLFKSYMEICNKSLECNKEKFPYKQILQAAQGLLQDNKISLSIYDDHPKATYDLAIHDNKIDVVGKSKKNGGANKAWHVNKSYLEKVVSNPQEYINNPAKIDWDWLQNRLDL
jgi:hypothetical protein